MNVYRLTFYLGTLLAWGSGLHGILPLRDQWSAANRALIRNLPEVALQLFQEFNDWYSEEAVTKSPEFREKWYRLWGLSSLQAGSISQGISLLETWMEENPDQDNFRAFIRFQLASAYLANGNPESAMLQWSRFIEDHPELPECDLVRWLCADLLISQSKYKEAIPHLELLASGNHLSKSGRALAKSALAMVLLTTEQHEESYILLDSLSDNKAASLWKAILAPVLTDQFLKTDRYELARMASGWFDSTDHLISAFKEIQMRKSAGHRSIRENIWSNHWNNQLGKASASIQSMMESGFKMKDLYLLRVTACLKGDAAVDAFVLARFLLDTNHHDLIGLREKAYAYCIEACIALSDWDVANDVIRQFLEEFPDNPELPNILFLQARTSAARNSWETAVSQIDRLLSQFPGNKSIKSWKVAGASWRLPIGRANEALQILKQLEHECSDSWMNYLRFEQARCHEQLNQIENAQDLYKQISSSDHISMLAEQAHISLLKIYLSKLDWSSFQSVWSSFQKRFPHSNNLATGELLLGSFHELSNKIKLAIDVYSRIARVDLPQSDHAHRQLSRIHAGQNDYAALRKHALEWIRQTQSHSGDIADQALKDCLTYQMKLNTPALPDSLVAMLMDRLRNNDPGFPCSYFLQLLHNQWSPYSEILLAAKKSFPKWIGEFSTDLYGNGKTSSWSIVTLYSANILEKENRIDSADSKRIQILTTIDPAILNQHGLYEIASTAHKYDFPESEILLNKYMERYEDSVEIPACIHMLAESRNRSGNSIEAMQLLETIIREWPDSRIYNTAALELAQLQREASLFPQAERTIETILGRTDLSPRETADTLLLRALVDRACGRLDRCHLNCERILILYPDIHDVSKKAREIIESQSNA